MRKAVFAILFVAVLPAVAVIVEAQQPKKVSRTGVSVSAFASRTEAFRHEHVIVFV